MSRGEDVLWLNATVPLLGMHASDAEKTALIDHYNQVATRPRGHLAAALAYVAESQHEAMATALLH